MCQQKFTWSKVYPLPDGQAVNDKPEKPIPIQNQPAEDLNQQQSVDSGNTCSTSQSKAKCIRSELSSLKRTKL